MAKSDILEPQDWTIPVPIAFGPGRLAEIGDRCHSIGIKRPLIVTDSGSDGLPFIRQLQAYLAQSGLESGLFRDISPNPRDDEIGGPDAQRLSLATMMALSPSVAEALWTAEKPSV